MRPLFVCFVGACSLTTSFDGLTGGAPGDAGGDAPAEKPVDASAEPDAGDPSLLVDFAFDEASGLVAHDASGNGIDSALHGAASFGPGKKGNALVLDGASGYAQFESPKLDVLHDALTIAVWVNLDQVPYDQRVLLKLSVWDTKLNSRYPQLGFSENYATLASPVPPGEWHHFAFTLGGGVVTGYLDGARASFQSNTFPAGAQLANQAGPVYIGADGTLAAFAKGRIDELRIYARTLSADEVASLAK